MYVTKTKRLISFTLCLLLFVCMMMPMGSAEAAMAKGDKWVGQIIAGSVPSNFATYWNQVTPENSTKWGSVEGSRDVMNWGQADMAYNYAKTNKMPFKFHVLVWGSQEPNWIKNLPANDQKAEVLEWMEAVAKKYPNCDMIDVVNEPLHSPASYRNAIGGSGSTGWDWIVWSFEQARRLFPNSKLLINEYGIISDPNAANNYVKIINILKSKNLVDGIGIQCHQFNMDSVSTSTMRSVLNTLGATGLPIYVSELDITGDDNTQLNRYKEKFPVLYESQYVKGITLWGWIQGTTWINNTHLISTSGQERPALTWLKQYLSGFTSGPSSSTGPTSTPKPSPSSPITSNTPSALGDLNKDGAINMSDVMIIANAFNLSSSDPRYNAQNDLNNDGAINMTDVMVIASKFNTVVSGPTNIPTPTSGPKATIKVMPLGDSITDGMNLAGGYRIKLWKNITGNGQSVDFVGSGNNGPAELGDKDHEGHSGWTISQIDLNINSWMDKYKPQIVLLHIGTNDMWNGPTGAPERLSTLIDKICAKLPAGGKLYVSNIIPFPQQSSNVNAYNSKIPGIVQQKAGQGKPVYFVEMYSALTSADLADGVHPNATGYNKMADVWYNAIKADLSR